MTRQEKQTCQVCGGKKARGAAVCMRCRPRRAPIRTPTVANCLHCGSPLARKRVDGRFTEALGNFIKRRYCDRNCVAKSMVKDVVLRKTYCRRARIYKLSYCERCGTSERKLGIHHIDRDWRNNELSNLQTLCDRCHTTVHHMAGDLTVKKPPSPCEVCGKIIQRRAICDTCRTRIYRARKKG